MPYCNTPVHTPTDAQVPNNKNLRWRRGGGAGLSKRGRQLRRWPYPVPPVNFRALCAQPVRRMAWHHRAATTHAHNRQRPAGSGASWSCMTMLPPVCPAHNCNQPSLIVAYTMHTMKWGNAPTPTITNNRCGIIIMHTQGVHRGAGRGEGVRAAGCVQSCLVHHMSVPHHIEREISGKRHPATGEPC
jgi:hypothetical protein